MKNLLLVLAGALILPQTYLFADDLGAAVQARIDARVDAMRQARTTGSPHVKTVSLPKPTVGTAVGPKIIEKVLVKPDVAAIKETTIQKRNEVVTLQNTLKTTSDPVQKAVLRDQIKTQTAALKVDKAELRKTLIREVRAEIRKAAKARGPAH